ncbi:type 1 glutamine amidotransferase domain-containing protein [Runella sp. MFBS21]|jgi:putative intracellular protease/amidase|uniref:type 1 glutamine amidotransferase domain-containing protein n=1 Tax=Runella TaxID=105 RepID=UPI00041F2171|nr:MULTISPECIES: type 1 glutamine amidotransferase domain-containing protein [Runella]MDF7819899.1 type 1 glutamine amidotransferase domain-containing protein [Runella sp. MFBS21]
MSKKILAVLSEYGYWGVELVGPLEKLEAAGYTVEFITPKGKKAEALPPSYDTTYVDPPLGVCVTTPEAAEKVKAFEATNRLEQRRNLSEEFPERPYFSTPNFLRAFEQYYEDLKVAQEAYTSEYAALLLVGGSGPIIDMVNNQRVHDLILAFYKKNLPIGAICYGVAPLVFARDFNERISIIKGKHVTGHCIEYDYHDGTGFLNTDLNMGPPPYCLEYILADAVGPDGQFHGNFGKATSVIVDYPFITARSLQCSFEFGEQFVNVLDNGMKRYGW